MIVTDSGVHVWQAPTPEQALNAPKAHLPDPIGYQDLRKRMADAGVDRAVLVPPYFAGGSNEYAIEAAAKYPDLFTVMLTNFLTKPNAPTWLQDMLGRPGVKGARLAFHRDHNRSWIADGTADWFWPVAEKANIAVMVNAPSVLDDVARVAERHPGLRLIVDHMGRLKGTKDDRLGESIANITPLARHPNIFVKLTLVPSCSTQDYPYRNIHSHLRRLIETFGPRRCFWGSDISALLEQTSCTYRQAVSMFTEEMDFLSASDLEWIMGRGLAECLPWPVAPSLL